MIPLGIVFFQTLMVLVGFLFLGLIAQYFISFFGGMNLLQLFAFSLLLGTLMTPTSPATTIAVMTETRSEGKFTDLILGSAVVKDFFIIILFSFSLAFSKSATAPSHHFDFRFLRSREVRPRVSPEAFGKSKRNRKKIA